MGLGGSCLQPALWRKGAFSVSARLRPLDNTAPAPNVTDAIFLRAPRLLIFLEESPIINLFKSLVILI